MSQGKRAGKHQSEWLREICGDLGPSDSPKEIANLRSYLQATQAEFGKLLGVSHAAVSAWERGGKTPSAEIYVRLGNLAPYPMSIWFWHLAGLDPERILASFSHFIQEKKDEGAWPITPTASGAEVRIESAARVLGMSQEEVLRLIESGLIRARRFGPSGAHLVDYDSVIDHANSAKEVTAGMAARLLGLPYDTIDRLCVEGKLRARRIGHRGWWRIDQSSILDYKKKLKENTQQEK